MALNRNHTTEFLARVTVLLAEADAAKATIAQTDRILAALLIARRDEVLKELCGPASAPSFGSRGSDTPIRR